MADTLKSFIIYRKSGSNISTTAFFEEEAINRLISNQLIRLKRDDIDHIDCHPASQESIDRYWDSKNQHMREVN